MYNYFMIMGHVKSVEGNVLTITSTREFPELDGTRKIDEFKFKLEGLLGDPSLTSKIEVGIPIGVKGSLMPDEDKCITRVERLIFPQDRRMDMQLEN